MKVFDQAGKETEIPDEEAQAALTSGKYGLPEGTRVPVKTRDGKIGTVPIESLPHATRAGAQLISEQEHQAHLHDTWKDQALAAVEGAAQGATMDLYAPALIAGVSHFSKEKGGQLAQHWKEEQEAHPYTEAASGLAGALGAGLVTDGAEDVAAPEAIETRLATLAEREAPSLAQEAIPTASEASSPYRAPPRLGGEAGRFRTPGQGPVVTPSSGMPHAEQIAADMAASGTHVSPPVAQQLLSSTAEEATGAHVADQLGTTGRSLMGKLLEHTYTGAAYGGLQGAGQALTEDALSPSHDMTAQKFMTSVGEGALFGGLTGLAIGGTLEGGKAALGKLAPLARDMSSDLHYRSLFDGADAAGNKEARRIPGGTRAIGDTFREEGLIAPGETPEEILPKAEKRAAESGEVLGHFYSQMDAQGAKGPRVNNILRNLAHAADDTRVHGPLPEGFRPTFNLEDIQTLAPGAATTYRDTAALIASKGDELSYGEAHQLRRRIDRQINYANQNRFAPDMVSKKTVLLAARRAITDELERAGDEASAKMDGSFSGPLRAENLRFRRLTTGVNILDHAVGKETNRKLAPSDYLGGGFGAMAGLVGGHVPGAGLAGALLHRVIRRRGNSAAAVMLDKLATLGGVQEAVQRNDRELARGVAQLVAPGKRVAPKIKLAGSTTEQRMDWVQRMVKGEAKPGAIVAETLEAHAPGVSKAVSAFSTRAVSYLENLLPKPQANDPLATKEKKIKPRNVVEEAKFNRAYNAITSGGPYLLQQCSDGMLTRDEVKAFKTVHGDEAYKDLCDNVVMGALKSGKHIPTQTKVQLSVLLGEPVTPLMTPAYIQQVQLDQNVNNGPGPGGPPHATHGGSAPRIKPPKDIGKSSLLTGLNKTPYLP